MKNQSEPLLRVRGLRMQYVQRRQFSHEKFEVRACEDVNLTIHRGTTLALVGESGAGKSSLARCLALLEKPTAGEIWFDGSNLLAPDLDRKGTTSAHRQIQFTFQNPTAALNPRFTAAEIIAEPLVVQGVGTKAERRQRVRELMEQVGLSAAWETKLPLEFSGGQRQRLAIARAMSLGPKLLILDEALANLDLANQAMILKLLDQLQQAHSLTYLHISHDLRVVSRFADQVAVMHEGTIVEQKTALELFNRPEHSFTKELLAAMPVLESIYQERFA
jgi:ABC-type glutathione transport system ATPase component